MGDYQLLKNDLISVKRDVSRLIVEAKSMPGVSDGFFEGWEKVCETFEEEISKDIIRVAVVGAIKSGKSTFVNSLYQNDHLKRGAGVVTSIVTRIRTGRSLCAKLYFKSWKEVNSDLEQALVLFPSAPLKRTDGPVDIRNEKDRQGLAEAIDRLTSDQLIHQDARSANSVLISSYLKGYERVKSYIDSDERVYEFAGERFHEHRQFVGDDSLATYLRDIQLDIDGDAAGNPLEIADCQGSDSPNPLHVAMIQEYLYLAHFLIYVISSRTGLRQADIKFLSMIKRLGIEKNILFVINCDLSEHESLEDLTALAGKVADELAMIVPKPEIYALSALLNLFKSIEKRLSPKDRQRLAQWKSQQELMGFSDRETERFESIFYHRLAEEKAFLLLRNHLERLSSVNGNLADWFQLHGKVFSEEKGDLRTVMEKIQRHRMKSGELETTVKNTIDGALPKIKSELKKQLDGFFDIRSEETLGGIVEFVRNYRFDHHHYEAVLSQSGFSSTLYLLFHDFKAAIDLYIAENVNPAVVRRMHQIEQQLKKALLTVAGPYDLMVQETLQAYHQALADTGVQPAIGRTAAVELEDIDAIKRIAGIRLPPLNASMRYSAGIRSEAIIRLGFYSALKLVKKMLKKPIRGKEEEVSALNDGIRCIKRETEKSIILNFKDYRENMKYQYVFRLLDSLAKTLNERLTQRLRAYTSDLSRTISLIEAQQVDRENVVARIRNGIAGTQTINERILALREKMI